MSNNQPVNLYQYALALNHSVVSVVTEAQFNEIIDFYAEFHLGKHGVDEVDNPPKNKVLVTVSGGSPDYITEGDDVDLVVFDFDDYHDEPNEFIDHVPSSFREMAIKMGIPSEAIASDVNADDAPSF